jgi:hypothetical protein
MVEMIPIEYIVGFSMAAVNIFKNQLPEKKQAFVPFIAIAFCVIFHVINALIFGGDLLLAGRDSFIAGGVVVGMFAGGNAIGKAIQVKKPE